MAHPTPTSEPLPFDHLYSRKDANPDITPVPLAPAAVAHFDALLHEIHADAPRVDSDRLQQLAMWLLQLPIEQAHDVIDSRLLRLQELRTMLDDPVWDSDAAMRARIGRLLAYVDREDDLIGDRVPLLGRLDDVLMVELAWPAFSEEAEDYRDFCAYRRIEHPSGAASEQRRQWVRDRLDELALWRHTLAVREQHYAPTAAVPALFRVG